MVKIRLSPRSASYTVGVRPLLAKFAELRETHFDNERLARLGIEVMTLAQLRKRVPKQFLSRPERVDFYILLLVEKGKGSHVVDFTRLALRPGSLVFVRPGQAQQWVPNDQIQGTLVLVEPSVVKPHVSRDAVQHLLEARFPGWPSCTALSTPAQRTVSMLLRELGAECARFDTSNVGLALVRTMLTGLFLHIARLHEQAEPEVVHKSAGMLVRQLAEAQQKRLRERATLMSLARDLGYSAGTLNRACLAVEGRTAKQVLDRRVALEAQRLLIYSRDASGQVGLYLGFSEPTNFLKFFKRVVGCTPEEFRRRHAGEPTAGGE